MNPFEVLPLISNVPCKIECLASYGDAVYIGTSDGQVLLYNASPSQSPATVAKASRPHLLTKAPLGNGKKPVERIEVLGALGRILVLSDGSISLANMYNLELIIGPSHAGVQDRLPAWRACAAFTPQRGTQDYRLCVAHSKGRKLVLYEYVGGEAAYEFRRELPVPAEACSGSVTAVEWQGRVLALATAKKEVVLVDSDTGRATCVVFPGVTTAPQSSLAHSLPPLSASARAAAASAVVMRVVENSTTLIVSKEGHGFAIDLKEALPSGQAASLLASSAPPSAPAAAAPPAAGAAVARPAMKWQGHPTVLAVVFPFVIALQAKVLEVQYLSTQQVVQSVSLEKTTSTSSVSHSSAAAPFTVLQEAGPRRALLAFHGSSSSPACVYEMQLQPLEAQVRDMLKAQRFADAIELYQYCSRGADGSQAAASDNDERVAAIHMEAAAILISYLRFSEAFDHFTLARADPRVPLDWFPDVLPPKQAGPDDIRSVVAKSIGQDRSSPAVEEHVVKAKRCLMDFLETYKKQFAERKAQKERLERSRLVKKQHQHQHQPNPAAADVEAEASRKMSQATEMFLDASRDVNTALAKLYIAHKPSAVEGFLKQNKEIALEEVEVSLKKSQRWNALAVLYATGGREREALELWRKLGKGEYTDRPHDGLADTVELLGATKDEPLIWEFATWVLSKDKDAGLRIFTAQSRLDESRVVNFLESHDATAARKFLEHIVFNGRAKDGAHFAKLALLYVNDILSRPQGSSKEADELRSKLQKLLRSQGTPVAEAATAVLSRITEASAARDVGLHEEQAAAFEQLERHEDVLRILITGVKDDARAESYCTEKRTSTQASHLLIVLLRLYVQFDKQQGPLPERARKLLAKYGRQIDPLEAIAAVPEGAPISELLPFLEKAFRSTTHTRRDSQVVKALHRSSQLLARSELAVMTSRPVAVNDRSSCAICGRPLGGKVFVKMPHPSPALLCFRCWDARQQSRSQQPGAGTSASSDVMKH